MSKLTTGQEKLFAKLTSEMQPLQSLGAGNTFAIACTLEKKGLVELGHIRTISGQTVWAARKKDSTYKKEIQ